MTYSKINFKRLVRKSCHEASFQNLLDQKNKLSKGKEIVYKELKTQSYLHPESNLSSEDMCRILKSRIRDLDVKGNFVNSYTDTKCPINLCLSYESQSHLAHCTFYPETTSITNGLQYKDIFNDDIEKLFQIMRILVSRTDIRSKMIES